MAQNLWKSDNAETSSHYLELLVTWGNNLNNSKKLMHHPLFDIRRWAEISKWNIQRVLDILFTTANYRLPSITSWLQRFHFELRQLLLSVGSQIYQICNFIGLCVLKISLNDTANIAAWKERAFSSFRGLFRSKFLHWATKSIISKFINLFESNEEVGEDELSS